MFALNLLLTPNVRILDTYLLLSILLKHLMLGTCFLLNLLLKHLILDTCLLLNLPRNCYFNSPSQIEMFLLFTFHISTSTLTVHASNQLLLSSQTCYSRSLVKTFTHITDPSFRETVDGLQTFCFVSFLRNCGLTTDLLLHFFFWETTEGASNLWKITFRFKITYFALRGSAIFLSEVCLCGFLYLQSVCVGFYNALYCLVLCAELSELSFVFFQYCRIQTLC